MCHYGLISEWKYPYNSMRLQRPVEKSKRKPASTKGSTINTYFTQMGKGLRIQHGREQTEALNSPTKEPHEDIKHTTAHITYFDKEDFISYPTLSFTSGYLGKNKK